VVVVDNASTDGSIEHVEAEFGDRVRVIRRSTNGGYAAGANTGWRTTDAPIVAIVNQDLTFEPNCLGEMRRVLRAEKRDALVTPKLVLKSDPSRVNAIGNDVALSGVAWCHGLGTPADAWHGVAEVTAISGAAFMARREFLERLGGVEEGYFMYMEDVDLSLRARLAGGVCLAACDAVAVHAWAIALTPQKFGLLERNRRSAWKRLIGPSNGLWLTLLQAEAMGWTYGALRGKSYLWAKWRARRTLNMIPLVRDHRDEVLRSLSRKHPYDVLFPDSPLVASLGGFVDRLAIFAIELLSGRKRDLDPARGVENSDA
jgi:GT2 family glycosyltransferase